MADKTKAVALNRQCGYEYRKTIPFDLTRAIAGGQILNCAIASVRFPELSGEPCARCTAMQHTSYRVAKMQLGSSPQLWSFPPLWYQPFGSMPLDCSSFLRIRFIHVARDESPSLRISSSSCARNSSLKRIWYCGDFFNSCVDMCNYPDYHLSVITRVITFSLKSNAPDCSSSAEASNQTVIRGNDHG